MDLESAVPFCDRRANFRAFSRQFRVIVANKPDVAPRNVDDGRTPGCNVRCLGTCGSRTGGTLRAASAAAKGPERF